MLQEVDFACPAPRITSCYRVTAALSSRLTHITPAAALLYMPLQSTTLEELYMSRTTLSGELPDSFSPDSQLRVWYAINRDPATGEIAGPGFTGTIPSSLSNAANLAFVELSHHQLTGGVPILPAKIRMFESQSNALDGTIACEWCGRGVAARVHSSLMYLP